MRKRINRNNDAQASTGNATHGQGDKKSLVAHAKHLNSEGRKLLEQLKGTATAEQTSRAEFALNELEAVTAELESA